MFGRPRCREWTPLSTQQLRLRSLIQIVGYNIRPPESCCQQCSFYMTLHHTTMSAPFYTSERISSPHPKWKDIDSEITQRMSSTNVVIRIWCHEIPQENCENVQDTIIQTWGVYFSGLRYIGANLSLNFTSDCFKSNTLVFQMHGGYFCSYKSLKLDIIPHENEIEHGSMSSDSSGRTNLSSKITLETKLLQNHGLVKEARSVSPSKYASKSVKEYSKSQSPVETGFKQHVPIKPSSSLNINQRRTKSHQIFEHSPETLEFSVESSSPLQNELSASNIDLSETAENYDLRSANDWVPKYRYLALSFLKSEIRPSYNIVKLQKLHLLQYSIKKRQEAMLGLKERIYKKSALQNVDSELSDQYEIKPKFKSRSQRNLFSEEELEKCTVQSDLNENGRVSKPNEPRLTLKLNDLLSFKSKPSPYQISEHVRLTKQLEILRFKRRLLSDERDAKLANIRRLKEIYSKLCEENQDIGSDLMQKYHDLSRSQESVKEGRESARALREMTARAAGWLKARRARLLADLQLIFCIEQHDQTWTIVNTPLPISSDDSSPCAASDAVGAGLAAQALCVAAGLLQQPLRYSILARGSASSLRDLAPQLEDQIIPLYARGGDVTLFRYGMFLLNKCVAQLLWARGLGVPDMRPTLANLRLLLTTDATESDRSTFDGPRAQSLRSLVASDRGKHCRQFNRFKETVEGQPPHALMSLRHRHSRSVGSCRDTLDLAAFDTSVTSIMGSEPNMYNTKLSTETIRTHNSDSEISKITEKVVFTLGTDDPVAVSMQKLVKISINNENECDSCIDENVKRICSEINSFCTQNDVDFSNMEEMKDIRELKEDQNSLDCDCELQDDKNRARNANDEATNKVTENGEGIKDLSIDKNGEVEDLSRKDIQDIDIAKHIEARTSLQDDTICDCEEMESQDVCEVSCANMIKDVIVIQSDEAKFDSGLGNGNELK